MHKFIALLISFLVLSSCSKNVVFYKYQNLKDAKWHKDSIVNFHVNITDTVSKNAIYINLRNNKDYDFNNLFLIVGIDFPNKTKIRDTLEYLMTDKNGYYLGRGYTDVKENKLEFRTDIQFPTKGDYLFKIEHAMRKNGDENGVEFLEGVSDIGIQIEKIN
jgi:gliding motility-associated lipoprotein GldH